MSINRMHPVWKREYWEGVIPGEDECKAGDLGSVIELNIW